MPFFSPEDVLKVRMKGSKTYVIPDLEKTVRIVKMTQGSLERLVKMSPDKNEDMAKVEYFAAVLSAGVADEAGKLLVDSDANDLARDLPLQTVVGIVNEVMKHNGFGEVNVEALSGKPSGSPSAS